MDTQNHLMSPSCIAVTHSIAKLNSAVKLSKVICATAKLNVNINSDGVCHEPHGYYRMLSR